MKIDFHNHYYPEGYLQALRKADPTVEVGRDSQGRKIARLFNATVPMLEPAERLHEMDRIGVDVQVLSLSAPQVYFAPVQEQLELARQVNDAFAQICQEHPGRFLAFANVPLGDVDKSLKELDRAIHELKVSGVCLGSNVAGRPLDSPEFFPFFEEASRLQVPVYIHPLAPPEAETLGLFQYNLLALVGFPFETTLAATRMAYSGLLERLPNLIIILSHLGGALPFLFERIDFGYDEYSACRDNLSQPPSTYFKRFYYETALSWGQPALQCALQPLGASQLLLGSDYPFVPPEMGARSVSAIEELGLSQSEKEAICYGNAERILKNAELL
ncbi:MAG: amidohydrolase family protein [Candidatus Binatia bacterium]